MPAFILQIKEIAYISGIPESKVSAVLDAFSYNPTEKNTTFNSLQDFNLANATPIIRTPKNDFLLFQLYSLAESIYELPYYWFNKDASYANVAAKNRGDFTESFCKTRLELVFGTNNVFQNVIINDSKGNIFGEIDVLVIFGIRAIVLQAKSKRLTQEARKGQDGHIKNDFKKGIQDAYDQGLSCTTMLCDHKYTKQTTDKEINITRKLKAIYILCVVADHYPSLNFQSRQFLKYETTETINPPMV